jgi:hypothetical protein
MKSKVSTPYSSSHSSRATKLPVNGNGDLIKADDVLFIGVSLTKCLETNISGADRLTISPSPVSECILRDLYPGGEFYGPEWALLCLQWMSSGDGMDIGPVLALEPLSTILPGNYRYLQHIQALDRPTLFLGDHS